MTMVIINVESDKLKMKKKITWMKKINFIRFIRA